MTRQSITQLPSANGIVQLKYNFKVAKHIQVRRNFDCGFLLYFSVRGFNQFLGLFARFPGRLKHREFFSIMKKLKFRTQLVYYALSTLTSALLSLISISMIIHHAGAKIWTAIAIGQAVGNITGIFISLGSVINGPRVVAESSNQERKRILILSTRLKFSLLIPISLVSFFVSYSLANTDRYIAGLSSILINFAALSFSWFFIGKESPKELFYLEILPRNIGVVLSLLFLWRTSNIYIYLGAQFLFLLISYYTSYQDLCDDNIEITDFKPALGDYYAFAKSQFQSLGTVIYASLYLSFPVLIIARLQPSAVGFYALGDKLIRNLNVASTPLLQWLQGWVPNSKSPQALKARIRKGILLSSIYGLIMLVVLMILGTEFTKLISHHQFILFENSLFPIGVSLLISSISRAVGLVSLVSLKLDASLTRSALIGAIISIPIFIVCIEMWSFVGAFWGLAAIQLVVTGYQIEKLHRKLIPERYQITPIALFERQHES